MLIESRGLWATWCEFEMDLYSLISQHMKCEIWREQLGRWEERDKKRGWEGGQYYLEQPPLVTGFWTISNQQLLLLVALHDYDCEGLWGGSDGEEGEQLKSTGRITVPISLQGGWHQTLWRARVRWLFRPFTTFISKSSKCELVSLFDGGQITDPLTTTASTGHWLFPVLWRIVLGMKLVATGFMRQILKTGNTNVFVPLGKVLITLNESCSDNRSIVVLHTRLLPHSLPLH